MRISRAAVPTFFTLLNMFSGLLSIIYASEGRFDVACYLIMLAGLFDALDGMMARLTKSSSQFGVEIDSLSDVVSFGAAPAFLVYKLHLFHFQEWGILISSLLMIMGGIRLARFNVQLVGFDKQHFSGLPIPSSAFTVVSFVLTFLVDGNRLEGFAADLLAPMCVLLSLIMVSTVKYDTLPKLSAREFRMHPVRSFSFVAGLLLIVLTKGYALFFLFAAFIVFGLLRSAYLLIVPPQEEGEMEDEVEPRSVDV